MIAKAADLLGIIWQKIVGTAAVPPSPNFVSLAPTANADESGVYSAALRFAIKRKDVLNIALTGPYGSGKSSVIETFLATYPKNKTLRLSLASFAPDAGKLITETKTPDIERSLLQQILYGVKADTLPFSRFKRIQTPKPWSAGTSFLIVVGAACAWYLISKQPDVLSGSFFRPFNLSNWLNFTCLAVATALAWRIIHKIYTTSFGLSLKSISLKDVQIAPEAANETSILNRHLDEILYFFRSTRYDLVIIEDLDRFKSADIFVILREINGLINSNAEIKRSVRFLYALRDDLFDNKDRTKFFEFIIPIIPVINHSNSIDKVIQRSESVGLDAKLDKRFVRDVSRHLTDLRLIHNIFNEYLIYSENLNDSEGHLDPNKLLAVLIYKNVFPSDFASLHHQQGVLARVLSHHDAFVSRVEDELNEQISKISAELDSAEAQELNDETELRMVYAMAIAKRIPWNYPTLRLSSGEVAVRDLPESPSFEEAISRRSLVISDAHGRTQTVDLTDLERSVDANRTFAERKVELARKSTKFKQDAQTQMRALRNQLASVRTQKFNELLRGSSELINDAFVGVRESVDLLRFLILEGYLDDTYYQYISLFHRGRMSHNDNQFLIQIRAYKTPSPDFPIDSVAEVVVAMRREDFGYNYVLNRFVVDYLLEQAEMYPDQVAAMAHFVATHFEECEEFFRAFYARGAQVRLLVTTLAIQWPEFPSFALQGSEGISHAARLLAFTPDAQLMNAGYANGELADFLSSNTREVLGEGIAFDVTRLRLLGVRVNEVSSLSEFPDVYEFVAKNGLYALTTENIDFVFRRSVGSEEADGLKTRHFSTLLKAADAPLLDRVRSDFQSYVSEILLTLNGNIDEELTAIAEVLAQERIEYEVRKQFWLTQTAIFPDFGEIPEDFYAVALEEQKITPSWKNCLTFMYSEAYSPEQLTEYLQGTKTHAALAEQQVPASDQAAPLREFLIESASFSQDTYRSYVRQLPMPFPEFPEVDGAKIEALIEEQKVLFTPETFESLNDVTHQVLFVAQNFTSYAADKARFPIDENLRTQLLRSKISDAQKVTIIGDMAETYVASNAAVAAVVGPIVDRSMTTASNHGSAFIRAIVVHSRPIGVQVSLLNKLHSSLSPSEVRDILASLPDPFKDIAEFGKSPRLEDSPANRLLATWLKEQKIISSFAEAGFGSGLRIYTRKKPT